MEIEVNKTWTCYMLYIDLMILICIDLHIRNDSYLKLYLISKKEDNSRWARKNVFLIAFDQLSSRNISIQLSASSVTIWSHVSFAKNTNRFPMLFDSFLTIMVLFGRRRTLVLRIVWIPCNVFLSHANIGKTHSCSRVRI